MSMSPLGLQHGFGVEFLANIKYYYAKILISDIYYKRSYFQMAISPSKNSLRPECVLIFEQIVRRVP